MTSALRGLRVGFIERFHPPGYRGAVVDLLLPLLREAGARVDLVHAEQGLRRLDEPLPWDLAVLKSGSAVALHLAAAAEGWGIPVVNRSDATRLAQDKLASAVILQRADLPIASAHLAWLGPDLTRKKVSARWEADGDGRTALTYGSGDQTRLLEQLETLADRPMIVKAARGSRGTGLWTVEPGELTALIPSLPEGPYLLMEWVPHTGDDLKVFAAGEWMAAIERPFPAKTLGDKRGRPARVPKEVSEVVREAGLRLGLTCFGCDFVSGPDGWRLVDVNAFPGYKGAEEAPSALAVEISRVAAEGVRA